MTETARLARRAGEALWRQVELALAEEIARLPKGAERRLAGEHELARRFGVNRHTVRQAVRALGERGLVRVVHGRGMFAPEVAVDYRLGPDTRFSANLGAQERVPERRLLGSRIGAGGVDVLAALGLPSDGQVLVLETLGLADGTPLSLGALHLSAARFADAPHHFNGSITALYAQFGLTAYRRAATQIHARAADGRERRLLRLDGDEPVVVTASVDIGPEDGPIGLSISCWAASRVKFTTES